MVLITEELVRKKSEHNEGIIGTLEELSLHQEDVEKIENIHNWCKGLTILYLQANLISKIENLNKLKNLQYLNLAINNIERIENLERCEYLEKLDLTLNFIGELTSVGTLANNLHLKYLYLTGNPCTDYKNYRNYVIGKLPQLQTLDNVEITRSERIKALQIVSNLEPDVIIAENSYKEWRILQKQRLLENSTSTLDEETFWKTASENAPETRLEISNRTRKNREGTKPETLEKKKLPRLYTADGRPLNVNHAKIPFKFDDSRDDCLILDIAVYKHMDTSLIEVDVQPILVKVVIKGKVFQFVLPEEVFTDKSTAKRSEITGHLVLTMPKVNYKPKPVYKDLPERKIKREFLEVNSKKADMDFSKITEMKSTFDNPDVPPLEYG